MGDGHLGGGAEVLTIGLTGGGDSDSARRYAGHHAFVGTTAADGGNGRVAGAPAHGIVSRDIHQQHRLVAIVQKGFSFELFTQANWQRGNCRGDLYLGHDEIGNGHLGGGTEVLAIGFTGSGDGDSPCGHAGHHAFVGTTAANGGDGRIAGVPAHGIVSGDIQHLTIGQSDFPCEPFTPACRQAGDGGGDLYLGHDGIGDGHLGSGAEVLAIGLTGSGDGDSSCGHAGHPAFVGATAADGGDGRVAGVPAHGVVSGDIQHLAIGQKGFPCEPFTQTHGQRGNGGGDLYLGHDGIRNGHLGSRAERLAIGLTGGGDDDSPCGDADHPAFVGATIADGGNGRVAGTPAHHVVSGDIQHLTIGKKGFPCESFTQANGQRGNGGGDLYLGHDGMGDGHLGGGAEVLAIGLTGGGDGDSPCGDAGHPAFVGATAADGGNGRVAGAPAHHVVSRDIQHLAIGQNGIPCEPFTQANGQRRNGGGDL